MTIHMKNYFNKYFSTIKGSLDSVDIYQLDNIAKLIVNAEKMGNKVIIVGNGGSASIASHVTVDFINAAKIKAINFNESSIITCFANDYGYDQVFERQIEANAVKGDVLFGISTSGNSPNVLNAMKRAKKMGCKTIGLTGKDGGKLIDLCDISIIVPSNNTPRIQEAHITIIHIICDLLDQEIKKNEKFSNILR